MLSILAICSCSKKQVWDDSHIPAAYHDGVFSFDYEGTRYHQYSYRLGYGPNRYCAIAAYHPAKDTLAIVGRVSGCYINSITFVVPFEEVLSIGQTISLPPQDVWIDANGVVGWLSTSEISIRFNDFFNQGEYISGVFSATVEDKNHKQSKVTNGLFKMNAMPYKSYFYRRDINGNIWYSGPTEIGE